MKHLLASCIKRMLSGLILFATLWSLPAADLFKTNFMDPSLWEGTTGGKAPVPPEISLIQSPVGPAVQVKAVSKGEYVNVDNWRIPFYTPAHILVYAQGDR